MESNFFRWNKKDFLKGLLMAILVPVIVLIQTSVEAGQLIFDWKELIAAAIAGGVGYLFKNLLSGAKKTKTKN